MKRKVSPQMRAAIRAAIAQGKQPQDVAQMFGISPVTVGIYGNLGKDSAPEAQYRERYKRSRSKS